MRIIWRRWKTLWQLKWRKKSEEASSSVVIFPPSLPSSPENAPSLKNKWKSQHAKKSPRWKRKALSSSNFEDRGMLLYHRSIRSHHDLSTASSEERLKASRLLVIHPSNVTFADALKYRNYRLHNHSFRYNGKMAVRTRKLTKRIETITKPYQSDESDQVTVSLFLRHYKRASDSNGVSKRVALWLLPFFMANSPDASHLPPDF